MDRLVGPAVMHGIGDLIAFKSLDTQQQGAIRRKFGDRAHFAVVAKGFRRACQHLLKPGPDHVSLLAEQVHNGNSRLTMLEGFHGNQ
jgi:hypothetical protein